MHPLPEHTPRSLRRTAAARPSRGAAPLLVLAASLALAGVVCGGRLPLSVVARYASGDGVLEDETVRRAAEIGRTLLAAGAAAGCLCLARLAPKGPPTSAAARRALCAALLLFAAFVLYLPPYDAMSMLRDDPVRYAFSALNIFEGRGYHINLNRQFFPAKDFVGYPLLILPLYAVFGPFPGTAIYATFACALAVLILTLAICRRIWGGTAAVAAFLLLLSHYLFFDLSREVRSEMLSCALLLCVLFLFMELVRREGVWGAGAFLTGIALGCCYVARPPLLVALAALPAIFLARKGLRAAARGLAWIAAGAALVVAPYLWFCNALYGGPLRTGYSLWELLSVPSLSWKNIALNIPPRWFPPEPQNLFQKVERYLYTTNGSYYASSLLGLGQIYGPPVFLFLVGGVAASLRRGEDRMRRVMALAFLSVVGLNTLFYMTYAGHDERYFLAVLPLLFSLAAFGMSRALARVRVERIGGTLLAAAALLSLVASGVVLSLWREARAPRTPPFQYEMCLAYGRLLPPDGCIVTGLHPTMVDRYLLRGTGRAYYAISGTALYAGAKMRSVRGDSLVALPVEPVQGRRGEVRAMLRQGRVVMMDDWHDPYHPGQFDAERDALMAEFGAREVHRNGDFGIYRLSPQ